jgi:competence protein ComEC
VSFGRVLVAAVIAGTTTGVLTSIRPADAFVVSMFAASCALLINRPALSGALVAVAAAAIAAGHAAGARDRALSPPLVSWLAAAGTGDRAIRPTVIEGILARDAEPVESGARLIVDVLSLEDDTGRRPIRGRIHAHVAGQYVASSIANWSAGRHVSAPMLLRTPLVSLNPGGPSIRWQTLTRPFDLTGSVKSAALVTVRPGHWWDESAAAVRASIRDRTHRLFGEGRQETEAIVNAILIGDRTGLTDDVERRLQAAGTYHVVAISGGNVALVTLWSFLAARAVVRSYRWTIVATTTVVITYGWIVGGDPSVTRAVTAAVIYLACGLAGLVPRPIEVLGVVAMFVAVVDPLSSVDAGAWLSFGATLGIILFAPRVVAAWGEDGKRENGTDGSMLKSVWRRITLAAVGLFGATLVAELTLVPVSAAVFSRVGVAGLVLNFVAIPAMTVVQVAGAAGIALFMWPDGAKGAALLAHAASTALLGSAELVDIAPWLSWRVPTPSMSAVIAFYSIGVWWLWPLGRRPYRASRLLLTAGALAVVAVAPMSSLAGPASGRLRLTMLDVGQGESLLLQFPTGHALLVDAGGRLSRFDVGDRLVTPALLASGVRHLDWLMVTHADLDHIGGAASVLETFSPEELWEGVPVPADSKRERLKREVAERGVWRELQRGDRLELGPVLVRVLNPPMPDWERQRPRNADSVVLSVRYGDVELLLTGDIDADGERQLALEEGRPPLRILKVAHHGSRTSTSAEVLERFAPQLALVSAGRGNPFGHPAREVVDRLEKTGAEIFRTDRDGAVIVETDGREVSVRSMTGRTWMLRLRQVPV